MGQSPFIHIHARFGHYTHFVIDSLELLTFLQTYPSISFLTDVCHHCQVGWDESTAGERPNRVSVWDIEPVVTPFYICPPPFFRPKFPKQPGLPGMLIIPLESFS